MLSHVNHPKTLEVEKGPKGEAWNTEKQETHTGHFPRGMTWGVGGNESQGQEGWGGVETKRFVEVRAKEGRQECQVVKDGKVREI